MIRCFATTECRHSVRTEQRNQRETAHGGQDVLGHGGTSRCPSIGAGYPWRQLPSGRGCCLTGKTAGVHGAEGYPLAVRDLQDYAGYVRFRATRPQ